MSKTMEIKMKHYDQKHPLREICTKRQAFRAMSNAIKSAWRNISQKMAGAKLNESMESNQSKN